MSRLRCRSGLPAIALVLTAVIGSSSSLAQEATTRESANREANTREDERTPDPASSKDEETFYETATVTARPLASASGSISVLDRDKVDSLVASDVSEILAFVPGISISGGPRGSLAAAEVRGGDPNFTLVLVDGIPLNDPTDTLGGAFNLASFATTGLDRLEVVRGPASSLYGSSALGGVIQLITRSGGERFEGSAELEAGSHDSRRLGGAISGPMAKRAASRLRGSLSFASQEEAGLVGQDRFELSTALGGLDWDASEASRLAVRSRVSNWRADDYPTGSGGPRLGLGLLRFSDHREASLSADLELEAETLSHQLSATYYRHHVDRDSPPIPPTVPPSIEATRFEQFRLRFASTLSRGASRLSVGAELERQDGGNRSQLLLPPVFGGPLSGDYSRNRDQGGAFAEGIRGWSGPWGSLTVEAGARIDLPDDVSTQLSPRLGLGFRPGERPFRLRGSVGRAFKQPSFFALDSPPALGGNPELRPETSWGSDLGLDFAAGSSFSGSLTLFSNRYQDLIDFDFATFRLVNRDRVSAIGAELALSWAPSKSVQVEVNATHQDVEDPSTGIELLRRPEQFGSLILTLRPDRRLLMVFDLRVLGSRFDQQVGGFRQTLEGSELLGAAATVSLGNRWQLRLRGDNLLDQGHETELGRPGALRSVRLGFRYSR